MFMKPAEIDEARRKNIPRNDTGEVDLHRPFADRYLPAVPKVQSVDEARAGGCGCLVRFRRDALRAGTLSVLGPEDECQNTCPALDYPADFISEGMDQTRGWFYTMLAIATALGYKAPYKNVVALGLINDKFGQKMSKSKGNVVEPFAVIDKYGIDALRWYFFTGSPLGEPKNFDENEIAEVFPQDALDRVQLIYILENVRGSARKIAGIAEKCFGSVDIGASRCGE